MVFFAPRQSQALERMVLAARVASDELTDVALAELAKAIAEAVHAETAQQEVAEAVDNKSQSHLKPHICVFHVIKPFKAI